MTVLDLMGKVTLGQGEDALLEKITKLLDEGRARHILVNLEQVPYMDSAGIGALVTAYKHAKERGSKVKLLNPKKRVYDLLQVVKLDQVFECFTDEPQAIASFSSDAP